LRALRLPARTRGTDPPAIGGAQGTLHGPDLLQSQFEALEPPDEAIRVDIRPAPEFIAAEIRRKLGV
jgi:gluconokinase